MIFLLMVKCFRCVWEYVLLIFLNASAFEDHSGLMVIWRFAGTEVDDQFHNNLSLIMASAASHSKVSTPDIYSSSYM